MENFSYISTGLSLTAVLAALAIQFLKHKNSERERLIRTALPEQRADLVRITLEFFSVNTEGLTQEQQYTLAIEQIRARQLRFSQIIILIVILATIAGALAAYAIFHSGDQKTTPVPNVVVPDSKRTPNISAPETENEVSNYNEVWKCIPPIYRPNQTNFINTPPSREALINGLLSFTLMGEPGCVQTLLAAGADPNGYHAPLQQKITDGPALHLALRQKQWSIAQLLLEKGANPNLLDTSGDYSALDEACSNTASPKEIIRALKDHDARPAEIGTCQGK